MVEIRKLLYATDGETLGFEDLEGLMDLRKAGLEEILYSRAVKGEDPGKGVGHYGLKFRALGEDVRSLSRLCKRAGEEQVSMIAVNQKEEAKGRFLGSPIRALLRRATVPVMVMKPNRKEASLQGRGMFYHVIFATDWSSVSEGAMRFLLNLKGVTEMLEIVYVVKRRLSIRDLRRLKEKLAETRRRFLDEGMDAEAHVYAGKPAQEIMLAARDYRATSIIMGTSSRSPWKAFFTKSCSYQVAAESEVSTLFVPLS
jgi:nucleotide-binding universal stress UspA family protein